MLILSRVPEAVENFLKIGNVALNPSNSCCLGCDCNVGECDCGVLGCDCDTVWGVWLWSWSLDVVSEGDGGGVGCDCGLLGVWLRHVEAPSTDTVQPHWVCALPSGSHREWSQLVVDGLKRRAGSRGSSCCHDLDDSHCRPWGLSAEDDPVGPHALVAGASR